MHRPGRRRSRETACGLHLGFSKSVPRLVPPSLPRRNVGPHRQPRHHRPPLARASITDAGFYRQATFASKSDAPRAKAANWPKAKRALRSSIFYTITPFGPYRAIGPGVNPSGKTSPPNPLSDSGRRTGGGVTRVVVNPFLPANAAIHSLHRCSFCTHPPCNHCNSFHFIASLQTLYATIATMQRKGFSVFATCTHTRN